SMPSKSETGPPLRDPFPHPPPTPEPCQWSFFLRNHDELTLEMVTAEEREYMYYAYAPDRQAKLNLGIRRRLAPLLDNDRRKVELLTAMIFTMPGSPVLYYGDEIGMGDNIYLGDRDGVRTPMQWSGEENAGFSRAEPSRLYSPVIRDPVYGYPAINVEAQLRTPTSLLNAMRQLIATRKRHRAMGRGTIEFLRPVNHRVLAYLREYQGERLLVVNNLAASAQPVHLDLRRFAGQVPVDAMGGARFPIIGSEPYPLSLGPYGYYWFRLEPA